KVHDQRSEVANVQARNIELEIENADMKKNNQRFKALEAEHNSTLSVVESLRKQLMAKSPKLNSANNDLRLIKQARDVVDHQRQKLAKAHDALKERSRGLAQQVSDLSTKLTRGRGGIAALLCENKALKSLLEASEGRVKEAEMTSARLQFALDAMDAEIEEQRRLVDILREQFHALGRNNGEAAMGDPTEVLSAISSASPIHVFTESRRADDSAVGSDITASSPAAALQSLSESLTNGCANGIGACPRLPKPLKTATKRPNYMQGLRADDVKPAKHAHVEPNSSLV
ncbi:hypothetical protein AAVH_34190, partial [Aphelenchoides avenae]